MFLPFFVLLGQYSLLSGTRIWSKYKG